MVRAGFPEEVSRGLGARAWGRGVGTRPGEAGSLKHMFPGVDTGCLVELRLGSPRQETRLEKAGADQRGRPVRRENTELRGRAGLFPTCLLCLCRAKSVL